MGHRPDNNHLDIDPRTYASLLANGAEHARIAGGLAGTLVSTQPAAAGRDPSEIPPIGGDDIADDTTTTATIAVQEGQSVQSALEHPGDNDYFQVGLSAGQTYEFTLTPDDSDATTGPDLLLEVYDSSGTLVATLDGASNGATEELDFTPTADGTYYVNVAGYLDAAVGAYTITGKLNDDAPQPNDGTPLAAIDWGGVRVDTDGKTTGSGDDVIQVYFAKTGEVYQNSIPPVVVAEGWTAAEKANAFTSFHQYENIVDVKFVEVDSADRADFVFLASSGPPVLLGAMNPPGESYEGQAWFNKAGVGWQDGLAQGGYGFITFTHELGHGMGLAHPHDNGGGSEVMHGVSDDQDSGDFHLNQGVFTVMTYNDGWPDGPNGVSESNAYGWSGTLMAMDIAVLQQKYGVNTEYNTGNDTYTLWDENAPGTMYACIWDAGGRDTISAGDAMNTHIDLREATLKYETGGGGWVSYADGIIGGYTIANGVTIENAKGGAGSDVLGGNTAGNALEGLDGDDGIGGRGGSDFIYGGGGNDVLYGGRGDDVLNGGAGRDLFRGGVGADTFAFGPDALDGTNDLIFDLDAGDAINLAAIDANAAKDGNQAFRLVDAFTRHGGEAVLAYDEGKDRTFLWLDDDGDGKADAKIIMAGDQTGFSGFVL
jgi:serralysin